MQQVWCSSVRPSIHLLGTSSNRCTQDTVFRVSVMASPNGDDGPIMMAAIPESAASHSAQCPQYSMPTVEFSLVCKMRLNSSRNKIQHSL